MGFQPCSWQYKKVLYLAAEVRQIQPFNQVHIFNCEEK